MLEWITRDIKEPFINDVTQIWRFLNPLPFPLCYARLKAFDLLDLNHKKIATLFAAERAKFQSTYAFLESLTSDQRASCGLKEESWDLICNPQVELYEDKAKIANAILSCPSQAIDRIAYDDMFKFCFDELPEEGISADNILPVVVLPFLILNISNFNYF